MKKKLRKDRNYAILNISTSRNAHQVFTLTRAMQFVGQLEGEENIAQFTLRVRFKSAVAPLLEVEILQVDIPRKEVCD
ncbi:hypothetical protein E2C01_030566 [Portunus trituberculatus]|uniref:Uncharacterized protein n=1 Tax=Portunus trituberculatus TaxID=210409 RepID=A0A5B7EW38_PORTR|nr:hypothetical protein [Portunus trituberculatus]